MNLLTICIGSLFGALLFALGSAYGLWISKNTTTVKYVDKPVYTAPPTPPAAPTYPTNPTTNTAQRFILRPDKSTKVERQETEQLGRLLQDMDPEV
jgi:cytochrome c biogenesis protein ResB